MYAHFILFELLEYVLDSRVISTCLCSGFHNLIEYTMEDRGDVVDLRHAKQAVMYTVHV